MARVSHMNLWWVYLAEVTADHAEVVRASMCACATPTQSIQNMYHVCVALASARYSHLVLAMEQCCYVNTSNSSAFLLQLPLLQRSIENQAWPAFDCQTQYTVLGSYEQNNQWRRQNLRQKSPPAGVISGRTRFPWTKQRADAGQYCSITHFSGFPVAFVLFVLSGVFAVSDGELNSLGMSFILYTQTAPRNRNNE